MTQTPPLSLRSRLTRALAVAGGAAALLAALSVADADEPAPAPAPPAPSPSLLERLGGKEAPLGSVGVFKVAPSSSGSSGSARPKRRKKYIVTDDFGGY